MRVFEGEQYVKVTEVLQVPAAPSLSFDGVKEVIDKIPDNDLIQEYAPQVIEYVDVFNSVLEMVEPVLEVAKIIEIIRPAVNIGVQVVGAFTNPALVPQLIQDGVTMVQQYVLNLVVTGIQDAQNYILNTELNLGAIDTEDLEEIKDKLNEVSGELNDLADKTLNSAIKNGIGEGAESGTLGMSEKTILTIVSPCSSSGNIEISLKGDGEGTLIPVTTDLNTSSLVASEIRNSYFDGYTTSGTGNEIIFTATDLGKLTGDNSLNSGSSGVEGSLLTSRSGANESAGTYLERLNSCIEKFLENTKNNIRNEVISSETKEEIIIKIKEEFKKTGTCLDTSGDNLFDLIDSLLNDRKNRMAAAIKDALSGIDIDISNLQNKFNGDGKNLKILESIKNGLLNTLKNIIVENNRALLGNYLARDNSDIERLMRLLKELLDKDIANKKYLCLLKIKNAIEGLTDLEEIKAIVLSILETCPIDFDLYALLMSMIDDFLKGFLDYKKNRADQNYAANKRAKELYDIAYNMFLNLLRSLKSLLANSLRDIKECENVKDLESDQIITANFDDFISDLLAAIAEIINGMVSFDLELLKNSINNFIDNYDLSSQFNDLYNSGEKTICYKFTYLRGILHRSAEEKILDVRSNYKKSLKIPIPEIITKEEEKSSIAQTIDIFMKNFLDDCYNKSIDVFIKNIIPCKDCISCGTLKEKMLNDLKNNAYLFKLFAKKIINKALAEANYSGTFEENKANALASITQDILNSILEKLNYYFNYNDIFKKMCCVEQEKLKKVLMTLFLK